MVQIVGSSGSCADRSQIGRGVGMLLYGMQCSNLSEVGTEVYLLHVQEITENSNNKRAQTAEYKYAGCPREQ